MRRMIQPFDHNIMADPITSFRSWVIVAFSNPSAAADCAHFQVCARAAHCQERNAAKAANQSPGTVSSAAVAQRLWWNQQAAVIHGPRKKAALAAALEAANPVERERSWKCFLILRVILPIVGFQLVVVQIVAGVPEVRELCRNRFIRKQVVPLSRNDSEHFRAVG